MCVGRGQDGTQVFKTVPLLMEEAGLQHGSSRAGTNRRGVLCASFCVLRLIGVFSFTVHIFCEVRIIGKKLVLEQVKLLVMGRKADNGNLLGE